MRHQSALLCLLALNLLPGLAFAADEYLCAQLDRIRAEENMPAIGAGIVLPEPLYPQHAPLKFRFITCASGVEKFGESKKVSESTQFAIGSISKPLTGLMVARVIADEKKKPNPKLRWDTTLAEFFPEITTLNNSKKCYYQRTVADLMAHTAGFPVIPASEPGDQWMPVESDPIKRRHLYLRAAVIDPPKVRCYNQLGKTLPQLVASYSGGSIIAAHMAEVVTGRSWEDLMRHAGTTTAGPGLMIGTLPDPAQVPQPFAVGHSYMPNGIPVVAETPQAAPTNGPAGSIAPKVSQYARLLTEFLDATKDDANRQLPDAERADLLKPHGLSNFNRLG